MTEKEKARLHAIVEGTVQGVGFRYFVQENAYRLNLSGWVRNRWDGTVEVTAEGERQDLEKLLQALRRGPRASTVTGVRPEWQDASGEFDYFKVKMSLM
jgi:acylphosphatase